MKKVLKIAVVLLIMAAIAITLSCTAGPNSLVDTGNTEGETAGFWNGLWHGMILGVTFIISLFNDNVTVYEVHNNGHLYDLGFLIGVIIVFGGGSGAGCSKRRRRED